MTPTLLTTQEIRLRLKTIPDWTKRARTIVRTFQFKAFLDGIAFVGVVGRRAEKANHHPDIDIRWTKVTLRFSTHDAGGLTELDFSLAAQCDKAYARLSGG